MKSNPGLVPYMCRGELQIEPFSTRAVNENKIPSLWVQLPPHFGIQKLVKKKGWHRQILTTTSATRLIFQPITESRRHGCHEQCPCGIWELPSAEKWAPAPLERWGSTTPAGIHWSHLTCMARATQIQGSVPVARGKGEAAGASPRPLAPMDRTHSCNTLCSSTAEAGSWKEKLIVSYVPLKFLLPLSCNSFSLLSAF